MDADADDSFDFDEFPDENLSPVKNKSNKVTNDEESESIREGFRQFSQRSQAGAAPPEDEGEEIESRNDFEKSLKEEHGVGLRKDENGKEYFFLTRHMNHLTFVNHLNAVITKIKAEKLMDEFRSSIDGRLVLFLYFAPMKSRSGEQDTLWKALLLSKETQARAFDLLMEELQKLGKDNSSESKDLALVAVSHIRFLDCIFDPKVLFDLVFDRDFHEWKPTVRDELIHAIPEIFGDIVSQNDAAKNLLTMITELTVEEDPNDFKLAIINSLKLLTTGKTEASEIRSKLIVRMSSMDARTAIEVVNMVIDDLDTNDLPSLTEVLALFSKHFKLNFQPTMGTKNKKSKDDVAIAIGGKIGRFIQLSGNKCWKVIGPFFRSLTPDSDRSENGDEESLPIRVWRIFDVILCISLMSIEGCSPSVSAALKSQITDESREDDVLEEKFKKVFEMNKFCLAHFPSLLRLSRSLLWSPVDSLNHFSTFLYCSLLRSLEKKRKETISSMLSHLDKSEREAASIFDCVSDIIKREYGIIKDHISLFHESFLALLPSLSITSARMFLTVVISICKKDPSQDTLKNDMEETSRRLLSSLSPRDGSLGIVCVVMQLQSALDDQHASNRDERINFLLDCLLKATHDSPQLRWTFYDEVRLMVERSHKWIKSNAFMEWANALENHFKSEFFSHRIDDETHSQTLESEKYVNEECKEWLQVSHEKLVELVPLFRLLKELSVLKCRWNNEEDSQEALKSSFDQFMYTFEANISMCGARSTWNVEREDLLYNSTIFFHLIQWIRILLNSFCEKEESEDSKLSKLKSMKFGLMFALEKQLKQTILQLAEVRVPASILKEPIVVVYDESAKKTIKKRAATKAATNKGKKKKKKDNGGEENEEEREEEGTRRDEEVKGEKDEENGENEDDKDIIVGKTTKRVPLSTLNIIFTPFKMSTVVQLMKLNVGKRLRATYLLDELLKIMKVALPKKEKKTVPWATKRSSPLDAPPIEYHGDGTSIWKWTLSAISPIMEQLISTSSYFNDLGESSQVIRDDMVDSNRAMANMLTKCLFLLTEIFTSKDVVNTAEDETGKRLDKRRNLMEIIEKIIKPSSSQPESENDDAETTVLRFILGICESVPTIDCAVAVMECCDALEGRDDEVNECLGRWCLKFIHREWTGEDGKILKGTLFKRSVKRLLELYLSYRTLEERPKAILWLLADQVAVLVGDSERRKSKMDTISSPVDDFVPQEINAQKFASINKETFPVVYRVLFSALNSTISSFISTRFNMSADELVKLWTKCGSAFCLLCLLLRVTGLRSNGVLMTASKEGRRFLALFCKSSGFVALLEDETTFSQIADKVVGVLKSMQTGNRSLQNITVYAKSKRNESLLRTIPDLRAAGEGWMRAIHSALTFLGCEEAFEIGLLKGRNIDGDEIRAEEEEREETPEDEREQEEEGGGHNEEDMDETRAEIDREGSPAY